MEHVFAGKWITDGTFAHRQPRNVFHRQLEKGTPDGAEGRNSHILFRRAFSLYGTFSQAMLYISADDYYKLYINGRFVGQGPSPCYHFQCAYQVLDIRPYLVEGENLIAVHTLYQGLVNRVWQSGDLRHGLICDVVVDGATVLASDESFLVRRHSAYSEMGICGYQTQFLERYDSRADEVGFEAVGFDDSGWERARICRYDDHVMVAQTTHMLEFERIPPQSVWREGNCLRYDFGANYVGYLCVRARGARDDAVTVRCAQELCEDGTMRFALRANCRYEEEWILSGQDDVLDWFDYKSFRYAELEIPQETVKILDVCLVARHYPFTLKASLKRDYGDDTELRRIWELCVRTQRYGVQEVIQDCMEREKGFYLGDGCYTALTNMLLTGYDSMVRKLIDDAFSSSFVTDTLLTCMDCSFMQEIAEYPLIMVALILWHYRFTGDWAYLQGNYPKVVRLLDAYRRDYETDCLLRNLDKWCVVEWPKNFQHEYDADIREGQVCRQAHVAINAYYIYAVRVANVMADILGLGRYRCEKALISAFYQCFYDARRGLFRDSEGSDHISLVGNSFVYGFDLCPDEACKRRILQLLDQWGIHSLSFFATFPILMRFAKDGEETRMRAALSDVDAWKRMLREDATTTFEGWGKDTKWNTSLFHLTMSYAAAFLADVDLRKLFL